MNTSATNVAGTVISHGLLCLLTVDVNIKCRYSSTLRDVIGQVPIRGLHRITATRIAVFIVRVYG